LAFLEQAKWPLPAVDDVTVDTPVPFDIREVWFQLDEEDKAVYSEKSGHGDLCIQQKGSASDLKPTVFELYGSGQAAPFKGPQYATYRPLPDRIRMRLLDDRFRFLRRDWPDPSKPDPLPEAVYRWIGGGQPLSILDFSGVPPDVADVAIGVVLSHLYQIAVSCPADAGLGRARPIWIILEEAHRFLGKETRGSAHLAKEAAERIAREGRKYGLGLTIVSQRPSELSETILSQVGSVVALRLSNPTDQATVKATLPDVVANLAEALPALRTGEALITGECLPLPTRVMIDRPVPGPAAADPGFESWRASAVTEDEAATAVAFWRGKHTT
jgi:hypothetical protein